MTLLNQDFVIGRDAPDDLKAFWGAPKQIAFLPGVHLYRFMSFEQLELGFKGSHLYWSPWWFLRETYLELSRMAQALNTDLATVARSRLAVPEDWNPTMQWLAKIELTKPVYAWYGRARYQPADPNRKRDPKQTVVFLGGLAQVYLPNLASDRDGTRSDHARVVRFGPSV